VVPVVVGSNPTTHPNVFNNFPAFVTGIAVSGVSSGPIFRPVNRDGRVWGESPSDKVIWQMLQGYARQCGITRLAPHDLRRTFAKLARKGRAALEQIQLSLGHASIQTTERNLGVNQDLVDAPCDHLGVRIALSLV